MNGFLSPWPLTQYNDQPRLLLEVCTKKLYWCGRQLFQVGLSSGFSFLIIRLYPQVLLMMEVV